ncbi:hypothetical protein BCU68_08595 [Vibrio sp. 10N.286.49.B3]|uniref:DUF3450 domain-containing protein n=1 Tax=Vibrio sp. 10N.286.49.B3 TaxID=1880855 RepID=UPI000C85E462|nr:DUF3450 domain-containing protein [Vibrio sp. 10N.286.49.B3]PMH46122.1 hypothetical protein BCU68_08595 [Vibrio sp. 10N.286.49.B3]
MTLRQKLALLLAVSQVTVVHASSIDAAQKVANKTNQASAQSQKVIDSSAEKTLRYKAEIEQLQDEVDNLAVYRNHLLALVDNQAQELASIDEQIEEIKRTRQGVVPLMYQMIAGLKQIVENDKPIRLTQREQRVEKLENMMSIANISDAEKYRRILEAYQIEMDYGIKLGIYQGQISLTEATQVKAEIMYLGRISLIARSLAGSKYWSWDVSTQQWQELDNAYSAEFDKAYAVANKQAAPSLIYLPISLPVATKQ